jgi:ribonuclease Z
MKVTFLGTSASTPTKDRHLASVNINFDGKNYLFDCPEGTQMQLMKGGISYMKIAAIFLSHFHGDHFLGLPGLLATMSMHQRETPLLIYGPKGVKEKVEKAINLSMLNVNFDVKTKEIKEGLILNEKNFLVKAFKLKHDVPCYGFVFKEKDKLGEFNRQKAVKLGVPVGPSFKQLADGKTVIVKGKRIKPEDVMDFSKAKPGRKVSFVFDTLPQGYVNKIKDSDLLIHESTFLSELGKRAKQTLHCTAKQAAQAAEKAKVKKLYLFHFSSRHKKNEDFEFEARTVFAQSFAAKDLMSLELEK